MSARRPRSEALRQEWRARFEQALEGLVTTGPDWEEELAATPPEPEPEVPEDTRNSRPGRRKNPTWGYWKWRSGR